MTKTISNYGDETRLKLLQAATDVFVEQGFQAARVQTIAKQAGVRLSAINYHFGNKAGLYLATLRYHADLAISQQPLFPSESLSVEQQFRFMIHSLLVRLLDERQSNRLARLVLREMVNPTDAMDDIFQHVQSPQLQQVIKFLRICLPEADETRLLRTALSILGQCVIYALARPIIHRVDADFMRRENWLQELEEHIVRFSWAGIQALRESSHQ